MRFKTGVLLAFALAVFGLGILLAFLRDSTGAYAMACGGAAGFFLLYLIDVLDFQIGGKFLSLSKRVSTLEQQNTELKAVVSALLKSFYVFDQGSSAWGGPTEKHNRLMERYLDSIRHLIADDPKDQAMKDLADPGT